MRLGVEAALVDGHTVPGDVEVEDGRIARVGLCARGRGIAVPGLVDLQVNGYAGVDLVAADGAGYRHVARELLAAGTTAFQPTFVTGPEDVVVAALGRVPHDAGGARILGAHLEGPFLSHRRLGAHQATHRRDPDGAMLDRLLAAGTVGTMTLAPELEGALGLIDRLRQAGIVASLGHTDATAAQAHAAFDRGAATVTHLFNAMRPFVHRDPGIAGAALSRTDVTVQIIVDGQHLADETVLVIWRAARGRVVVVSDAIAAAGLPDGRYALGNAEVAVQDGVSRTGDGVLAGSTSCLLEAVRRLHGLGIVLADAVAAASSLPARLVGADLGSIRPGAVADVIVLDDRLEVTTALVAGQA